MIDPARHRIRRAFLCLRHEISLAKHRIRNPRRLRRECDDLMADALASIIVRGWLLPGTRRSVLRVPLLMRTAIAKEVEAVSRKDAEGNDSDDKS